MVLRRARAHGIAEAVADGVESDAVRWFGPTRRSAARAAGEIELAPPQYVTLLWLRDYATVAAAMAAVAAATPIDYTPRFHFVEGGGAICVYSEDVAYDDISQFDAEGTRHRLYLDEAGWNYLRD